MTPAPTGYYRSEPRRFGYGELARMVRGQGTPLLMWIFKTLGISWRSAWASKFPTAVRDWIISPEQLSEASSRALLAERAQMEQAGFTSVALLRNNGSLYPTDTAFELYLHRTRNAIATVLFVRGATRDRTTVTISTKLSDGRTIETTNWAVIAPVPSVLRTELKSYTPTRLWEAHEPKVTEVGGALVIADAQAALDFYQAIEHADWNALIKRGVMVEMTPEELEKAQRTLESVNAGGEPGPNATVLVEMAHLMQRKQTGRQALWAFAITLALFVVAGALRWDTRILWLLLGALIFHEVGHYVTMRFFGYRNLRMVFVPLGGAAVIGQNYNVPGWKKAIVSLMGPLPGILVGAVCVALAFRGPNELRDEIALMTLVINGLNMLPIFPLDGGAYLNAILFCRNAKLEVVFKTFAALGLAAGAMAMRDFILGALAYFILLGLRRTYRLARLTEELRREVVIPCVNDPTELPLEIRNRVIDGVKTALRKPTHARTVAAHALGIFERLNARPPGVLGTTTLLVVYVLTFGLALISVRAQFIARERRQFAGPATPDTGWKCNAVQEARRVRRPPRLAIVTFSSPQNRAAFVKAARETFPTNAPATISETVFMPYAKEDARKLVRAVRRHAGQFAVEIERGVKQPVCYWSITAESDDAAPRLEQEINDYSPDDEATGSVDSDVERDGRTLRVRTEFQRTEPGFAAFGDWLCAQNCANILYTFRME
ncbi:MAG TPA: site-2 protease family protein [Verrucomicrobiae bacterium]|nr:site-2 protease family protein [Verrucomicrobiae bacterium]